MQSHPQPAESLGAQLGEAAREGDGQALGLALGAGADPSWRGERGWTAAMLAATGGHAACLRRLAHAGADLGARESGDGWSALDLACMGDFDGCARFLIEAGCDIEGADGHGWTPLAGAARRGSERCVRLLLSLGAKTGSPAPGSWAPAMHAAWMGEGPCVEILAQAGADLSEVVDRDVTAASLAKKRGLHGLAARIEAWALAQREARELASASVPGSAADSSGRRL